MKAQFFKLIVIALVISLASCKEETKTNFTDFKYEDKPDAMACGNVDNKLLKEAVYSLEDDIVKHYKVQGNSLNRAYSMLLRESSAGRLRPESIISEHTAKVFEALKQNNSLWNEGNSTSKLNYNSDVMNCIADNIQNDRIKSIFNSLLSTNSLTPKLIGEPLKSSTYLLINDKYLATYVALEYYYSNLFDVDFTTINFEEPETNVDFNQVPQQPISDDPHAGHNHD